MQRLFSMFPAGAPGVALFVLRNCIAVALAGCAFPAGWQHAVFVISLSMLCIGLLTPAVCVLAALAVLFELVRGRVIPNANVAVIVLSTLSLAVLGPGAYSIDARLFGRRVLLSTSSGPD
jgi:hypothetical protein